MCFGFLEKEGVEVRNLSSPKEVLENVLSQYSGTEALSEAIQSLNADDEPIDTPLCRQ